MNVFVWAIGGFLVAIFFSEVILKGTKLQTGLRNVLLVHILVLAVLEIYLVLHGAFGWLSVLLFWPGAFLTWFGVRSHLESSILLRMLFLLRKGSISETQLIEEYESHYGENQRLEELFRGALLERTSSGIAVTPKGKFILRVVSILK